MTFDSLGAVALGIACLIAQHRRYLVRGSQAEGSGDKLLASLGRAAPRDFVNGRPGIQGFVDAPGPSARLESHVL